MSKPKVQTDAVPGAQPPADAPAVPLAPDGGDYVFDPKTGRLTPATPAQKPEEA